VRERNKAYYDLEVGETGERPGKLVTSILGELFNFLNYISMYMDLCFFFLIFLYC